MNNTGCSQSRSYGNWMVRGIAAAVLLLVLLLIVAVFLFRPEMTPA